MKGRRRGPNSRRQPHGQAPPWWKTQTCQTSTTGQAQRRVRSSAPPELKPSPAYAHQGAIGMPAGRSPKMKSPTRWEAQPRSSAQTAQAASGGMNTSVATASSPGSPHQCVSPRCPPGAQRSQDWSASGLVQPADVAVAIRAAAAPCQAGLPALVETARLAEAAKSRCVEPSMIGFEYHGLDRCSGRRAGGYDGYRPEVDVL